MIRELFVEKEEHGDWLNFSQQPRLPSQVISYTKKIFSHYVRINLWIKYARKIESTKENLSIYSLPNVDSLSSCYCKNIFRCQCSQLVSLICPAGSVLIANKIT